MVPVADVAQPEVSIVGTHPYPSGPGKLQASPQDGWLSVNKSTTKKV